MATLIEQPPAHTSHEQVLQLIAQRWAQAGYCKVAIRPGSEGGVWPQFGEVSPDLVGWQYGGGRQRLEWIAKVETAESLSAAGQESRWRGEASLGLPFFVFVPKGYRGAVQQLAQRVGVKVNGTYEYSFVNKTFQLL